MPANNQPKKKTPALASRVSLKKWILVKESYLLFRTGCALPKRTQLIKVTLYWHICQVWRVLVKFTLFTAFFSLIKPFRTIIPLDLLVYPPDSHAKIISTVNPPTNGRPYGNQEDSKALHIRGRVLIILSAWCKGTSLNLHRKLWIKLTITRLN